MPRTRRKPAKPGALSDLSPLRILSQIALLQFCYYGGATVLIIFITLVAGQHPSIGLIFDWRNLRVDVASGWEVAVCWILTAVFTVIPLLLLISRSKLVPDFALTIHLLHLVVTTLYTHAIPYSLYWWAVQATSAGIMVSLGVWACQWRELQPLSFGGKAKPAQDQANGHVTGTAEGDEEGYEMGHRRGGGRDGAGEYEMVVIPPRPEPT